MTNDNAIPISHRNSDDVSTNLNEIYIYTLIELGSFTDKYNMITCMYIYISSIFDFKKLFSMWFNVVKTHYIILVYSIVIFTTTLLHVPMLGREGNDNHRN